MIYDISHFTFECKTVKLQWSTLITLICLQ